VPNHDFVCQDGHTTTRFFTFTEELPDAFPCPALVPAGRFDAVTQQYDPEGSEFCYRPANRQFTGANTVITYSGDGMAPPSQRKKGTGGS